MEGNIDQYFRGQFVEQIVPQVIESSSRKKSEPEIKSDVIFSININTGGDNENSIGQI